MRLSKLGMSMKRIKPDEMLSESILANHLLTCMQNNAENVIKKKLDAYGCMEVKLPVDQSRISAIVAADFVKSNLKNGKNLPITMYQSGTNHLATMMNAYSFHACGEDLRSRYYSMRRCFINIFHELGFNELDSNFYKVKISEDDFGETTYEKFMFVSDKGEDTILVNEKEGTAFYTDDIRGDQKGFEKKKAIEIGYISRPGQRYTKMLKATFKSAENEDIPYFMGCYQINVSKVLSALCENAVEMDGSCYFESNVAAYTHIIVYSEEYEKKAFDLYFDLKEDFKYRVLIDDRRLKLETKFEEAKMLGIPYIVLLHEEEYGEDDYYDVYICALKQMTVIHKSRFSNLLKSYD